MKKGYIPADAHKMAGSGIEMMKRYGFKPMTASERAANQTKEKRPPQPEGSVAKFPGIKVVK